MNIRNFFGRRRRKIMTDPQKRFCEEYIANGFNARAAYYVAFPNSKKDNKQPSYPYTLLKKQEIKAYEVRQKNETLYKNLGVLVGITITILLM